MNENLHLNHIHLSSADPHKSANWYEEKLGASIVGEIDLRSAPQITVNLGGLAILIRGVPHGEKPSNIQPFQNSKDYASHNAHGVDHFAFTYHGDLKAFARN